MDCLFALDVEDWYHILDIPSAPEMSAWKKLPSHVERNCRNLLDLFSEHRVTVTCFFIGWVAERYPELVREALGRGHEIASHGYSHRLVYEMTEEEFLHDAMRSKAIIEDITGRQVLGYRAAGFSVTEDTPWFFDKLAEAGYRYDASVFPASRGHGGMKSHDYAPYAVGHGSTKIVEFPATVARVFGRPFCFFGGGYLRFFPYPVIKRMTRRVLKEGRPVLFYLHPREIDPAHPRLPMNLKRRFKSYVNLKTTRSKLIRLFEDFAFSTFEAFLSSNDLVGTSERDATASHVPK